MIALRNARLFFFLCIFLALGIAAVAADGVTETRLPDGLQVLIKEVHAAPVVVVDVWYTVGSRNEGPGMTGASHLLEHMTYKGTKEFGKDDMRNLTKRNGAIDNGATYYDYTHYHTTIASDRLDLVLRMEASRMQSALIQQEDLDAERTVVRSELEGRENNPGTLLFQELMAAAFRAHPYQWPVIGWRADVEHITGDQLRRYYRTYYVPNNATLVIVGDIDTPRALAAVKKAFNRIPRGQQPSQWVTPEPVQYGERRVTVRRQGQVPMEMMAWHIPGVNHADTPALTMLEQILGSGRLSRLYQQIVETQVGVSAWDGSLMRRDTGVFLVGGVAAPGQSLSPIEKAIYTEIERMKTTPPSATEMQRALRQFEAGQIYGRDSITDQASQLGEAATVAENWRYFDQLLAQMRTVRPEDICRVAKTYLTEDNRTTAIFQPVRSGSAVPAKPETAPAQFSAAMPSKVDESMPATPGVARAQQSLRKRFTLPNGLVLIVQENHANATVAVSASLKAG